MMIGAKMSCLDLSYLASVLVTWLRSDDHGKHPRQSYELDSNSQPGSL